MTEPVNDPHDKFFKSVFSQLKNARSFVENYLPQAIVQHLQLDTLDFKKDSFIEPSLKEYFSDMLYQVLLDSGQQTYVYLLLEHKSHPHRLTRLQLLRYMVCIWEDELKGQKTSIQKSSQKKQSIFLPPILPIVFSQSEKGWNYSPTFAELFQAPDTIKPYLVDFKHVLCDLSQLNNDQIKGRIFLKAAIHLLKNINDPGLSKKLPEIFGLLNNLRDKKSVLEILEMMLTYISSSAPDLQENELKQTLSEVFNKGDGIMTTLAEKWYEQGIEQGIENEQTLLNRLIKRRYGEIVMFEVRPVIEQIKSTQILEQIGDWVIDIEESTEFLEKITSLRN